MYYTNNKHLFKKEADHIGKVIVVSLILFGLVIGVSIGLYVAARTLPLPSVTNNDFYRSF